MFSTFAIHPLLVFPFAGLLVWAAIGDLATLTIPNRIPLSIVSLYFIYAFFAPTDLDLAGSFITGAAIFLVGIVLFATGGMGGGDVKLMAAVGLWAGPEFIIGFLIVTGVAGGLLALVACTPLRSVAARAQLVLIPGFVPAPQLKGKIPYGLAIAAGGLYVAIRMLQL